MEISQAFDALVSLFFPRIAAEPHSLLAWFPQCPPAEFVSTVEAEGEMRVDCENTDVWDVLRK